MSTSKTWCLSDFDMAGRNHSGNLELLMLANDILENAVRINVLPFGRFEVWCAFFIYFRTVLF